MIIDTPTANDFVRASLDLINLAWSTVIDHLRDIDLADWAEIFESEDERTTAHAWYWQRVQPALGNGLALLQQSIEISLKGRIAAISPFLLIARDARDYPSGSDKRDVSFSAFRSVDAVDLVKVANTVCGERLSNDFSTFWDRIRRERNAVIHSVSSGRRIEADALLSDILSAYLLLGYTEPWPKQRMAHRKSDEQAAFPRSDDYWYGAVLIELGLAIRIMKPAQALKGFGFDKKARAYFCPHCYYETERKFQREEVPQLAQLRPNEPASRRYTALFASKLSGDQEKLRGGRLPV